MIAQLAFGVVIVVGVYLTVLGICAIVCPERVRSFLLGFVKSSARHWLEMALRILAGAAFVIHAPAMHLEHIFAGLGWLVLITTVMLMLIPWQWHQSFAQRSVPSALRYLPFIAVSALLLGGGVLFAAFGKLS